MMKKAIRTIVQACFWIGVLYVASLIILAAIQVFFWAIAGVWMVIVK